MLFAFARRPLAHHEHVGVEGGQPHGRACRPGVRGARPSQEGWACRSTRSSELFATFAPPRPRGAASSSEQPVDAGDGGGDGALVTEPGRSAAILRSPRSSVGGGAKRNTRVPSLPVDEDAVAAAVAASTGCSLEEAARAAGGGADVAQALSSSSSGRPSFCDGRAPRTRRPACSSVRLRLQRRRVRVRQRPAREREEHPRRPLPSRRGRDRARDRRLRRRRRRGRRTARSAHPEPRLRSSGCASAIASSAEAAHNALAAASPAAAAEIPRTASAPRPGVPGDAQLVDAEADEEHGELRHRGRLTADLDREPASCAARHGLGHETEHRGGRRRARRSQRHRPVQAEACTGRGRFVPIETKSASSASSRTAVSSFGRLDHSRERRRFRPRRSQRAGEFAPREAAPAVSTSGTKHA